MIGHEPWIFILMMDNVLNFIGPDGGWPRRWLALEMHFVHFVYFGSMGSFIHFSSTSATTITDWYVHGWRNRSLTVFFFNLKIENTWDIYGG